jgi:hypothetical protein
MAGEGKAREDEGGEPRVIEEAPQNEFERVFSETMSESSDKPDDKGAGAEAGGGDDKGKPEDKGKTDGTGEKPPEAPKADGKPKEDAAAAGGPGEPAKPEELTAADKQFLKSIGIADPDVTPKELVRLRRVHGEFDKQLRHEQGKAQFFGSEAKKVSEKYQSIKKAYKEIVGQQSPADRIRGVIAKIDMTKLSKETQDLLQDPAYIESSAILLQALGIKGAEAVPGLDDDDAPAAAPDGKAAPAGAAAPAQPPMTEAQAEERLKENINRVKEALKDRHPDIEDVYQDPAFREWAGKISNYEFAKLLSDDPEAHAEVLERWKTVRSARQAEIDEKKKNADASDGLRTHQSPAGPGGKKPAETNPNAIPSDEEYEDMTKSIAKHRVSSG